MTRCARCDRADCAHPDPVFQGVIPQPRTANLSTGLPLARDRFVSASFHAAPVSSRNIGSSAGQTNIKSSPAQKDAR